MGYRIGMYFRKELNVTEEEDLLADEDISKIKNRSPFKGEKSHGKVSHYHMSHPL